MLHRLPSQKAKNRITNFSAALFAFIGLVHLLRVFNGWKAYVGGWEVPVWFSWIAVLIAFYLSWKMYLMDK